MRSQRRESHLKYGGHLGCIHEAVPIFNTFFGQLWPGVWLYITFFYVSVTKILSRSNIRGKITTLVHSFRRYHFTMVQRPQRVVQVMVRESAMEVVHAMALRQEAESQAKTRGKIQSSKFCP